METKETDTYKLSNYIHEVQSALKFWNSFSLEEMTARFNVPSEDLPFVFATHYAAHVTAEAKECIAQLVEALESARRVECQVPSCRCGLSVLPEYVRIQTDTAIARAKELLK